MYTYSVCIYNLQIISTVVKLTTALKHEDTEDSKPQKVLCGDKIVQV